MKQPRLVFSFLLLFIHFANTSAQAPAPAPGPPGPTNVTKILEKAGELTTFIRLLKTTQVGNQLTSQLNNSNSGGVTIFAPTDDAFSSLKTGTLNSFTDEQKDELMEFHILPTFYSPSQFETASNPLRTQAGGSEGAFGMNVTTSGNSVNITTGITNATVASSVYTDGQLAVYKVDRVLLPLRFFVPPPPAPAPEPLKHKKGPSTSDSSSADDAPDSSDATQLPRKVLSAMPCMLSVLAIFALFL